ncbi:MAG: hypothetical protein K8S15_08000 [Candidatus Aegiribacteria sp.]|nr:hypothetical protein [Candidatus Aegiribacteria sp.]
MRFDEAINNIYPATVLKRIASAHVVDYRNLKEDELRDALLAVKPQYLHEETVSDSIEKAFFSSDNLCTRVLSKLILIDILTEQLGFGIPSDELEEKVVSMEQNIVDRSNEVELADLAGSKNSDMFESLELYNFVLGVAWEHRNTKSPDEANLLRRLRTRLGITKGQHRILEAKLGKYPKANNELHSRSEIRDSRNILQKLGLLFQIRNDRGCYFDLIPEELAEVMKKLFKKEMRRDGYTIMIAYKAFRTKAVLQSILKSENADFSPYDNLSQLKGKILERVSPCRTLNFFNKDELHNWCAEIGLTVGGSKEQQITRIIEYYDSMQIRNVEDIEDERKIWYDVYTALAYRDRQHLRAESVIDKDIEIESKFEKATDYLFEKYLNHSPLNQPGTNKPDGLLSFKDMYIMWDNKSKETPGEVDLSFHLKQFHSYMENANANKHVPIFLVIAPAFTDTSEAVAIRYASKNIGRNIVLIAAQELRELAEEWASDNNKNREDPFPLGLLARPGRFKREALGKLY